MTLDNQSFREIEVLSYSGWAFFRMLTDEVARKGSLPKIQHIFCNDEIYENYTLPKEDPKNSKSRNTPSNVIAV